MVNLRGSNAYSLPAAVGLRADGGDHPSVPAEGHLMSLKLTSGAPKVILADLDAIHENTLRARAGGRIFKPSEVGRVPPAVRRPERLRGRAHVV